jgi:glycine/D-amino acid oxidase-like deaminating enzyme
MGPQTIAVFGDRDMPGRADTVVIGGGVIGVMTAPVLAEAGHGFGAGPSGGHLAADLVLGRAPIVDPFAFRLERYFDGTMPKPVYGV